MKYFTTLLILFIGLNVFAQDDSFVDFKEIFRKAKKDSTELIVYTKPPKGYYESINSYSYNPFVMTEGKVHKVMKEGLMIKKSFSKKIGKGEKETYKTELYYIKFDQILKIKIEQSEEDLD